MSISTICRPDRVLIVGVLNLTPDSFSDAGRFVRPGGRVDLEGAVAEAEALAAAGADVLDLGGESTRPGSCSVPPAEEIARTAPVIEAVAKRLDLPVSIDTRKARVAEAALDAGARIVNDVSGLAHDPALAEVVARRDAALVLGHLRGEPATMQRGVHFDDVRAEVGAELGQRVARAEAAGVARERLAVDPGLGFGKDLEHNLALLVGAGALRQELGLPVWLGPSRKSFLGALTGDPVGEREVATHAACAIAVFAGADALRVHDPGAARRVAAVAGALRRAAGAGESAS